MPLTAEELRARVLLDTPSFVVIDKPAGMPVHFGTKTTEDLEQFLPALADPGMEPPRLVHRLDKDTTGCLLLARSASVAADLGLLFKRGQVTKVYWAVVEGDMPAAAGHIDLPLLKVQIPGCSKVVPTPLGKPALTEWRCLAQSEGRSVLELLPRTGRMHQIRAHLAYLGHPILGDSVYGAARPPTQRLHLHARALAFPWDGRSWSALAPLPDHWIRFPALDDRTPGDGTRTAARVSHRETVSCPSGE